MPEILIFSADTSIAPGPRFALFIAQESNPKTVSVWFPPLLVDKGRGEYTGYVVVSPKLKLPDPPDPKPTPVPIPASILLLASALAFLGFRFRSTRSG